MTEKRNITKKDIFLKARLLSEGVRIEVEKPPEKSGIYGGIVLDGCGIASLLRPDPYSRLDAVIEGNHVTISDMGEVLGTATFEERPDWLDIPLSNGQPAATAVFGMTPDLIPIIPSSHSRMAI